MAQMSAVFIHTWVLDGLCRHADKINAVKGVEKGV